MAKVAPDGSPSTPCSEKAKLHGTGSQSEWEACKPHDIWEEFDTAAPNFFADLRIAPDGGLSEVGELFYWRRFPWAVFSLSFLLLNLFFIIVPNVELLASIEVQDWVGSPEISSRAMMLSNIWITLSNEDSQPKPKVVLAWLELCMLAFYLLKAAWAVWKIIGSGLPHSKWHGWALLLFDVIPELSTFSAMKCLHFVTPKILLPAAVTQAKNTVRRGGRRYGLPLLRFALWRVFCAFVGFEAFVIKFSNAAQSQSEATSFIGAAGAALAFLNQMLGVVDVHKFAHRRLFVYIFGGEDGFMSDREECVAKTYLAMLARKVWRETAAPGRKPRWLWFLGVTLSYGDEDFQLLTLRQRKLGQTWVSGVGFVDGEGAGAAGTTPAGQVSPLRNFGAESPAERPARD